MSITIRKSEDRAYFDHGWLKTYHTFSFASYYDPDFIGYRSLRVLNEDRLNPGTGFPVHPHKNMEIFTIVIKGSLAHQDDAGNGSILYPGSVQLMSAGTGVAHSESNGSDKEEVHFLQIWITPKEKNTPPEYQEKSFPFTEQKNEWRLIISPDGREESLRIRQDVQVYVTMLEPGQQLKKNLGDQRYAWIQIISGEVEINQMYLESGDGASLSKEEESFSINARTLSHVLLLDFN